MKTIRSCFLTGLCCAISIVAYPIQITQQAPKKGVVNHFASALSVYNSNNFDDSRSNVVYKNNLNATITFSTDHEHEWSWNNSEKELQAGYDQSITTLHVYMPESGYLCFVANDGIDITTTSGYVDYTWYSAENIYYIALNEGDTDITISGYSGGYLYGLTTSYDYPMDWNLGDYASIILSHRFAENSTENSLSIDTRGATMTWEPNYRYNYSTYQRENYLHGCIPDWFAYQYPTTISFDIKVDVLTGIAILNIDYQKISVNSTIQIYSSNYDGNETRVIYTKQGARIILGSGENRISFNYTQNENESDKSWAEQGVDITKIRLEAPSEDDFLKNVLCADKSMSDNDELPWWYDGEMLRSKETSWSSQSSTRTLYFNLDQPAVLSFNYFVESTIAYQYSEFSADFRAILDGETICSCSGREYSDIEAGKLNGTFSKVIDSGKHSLEFIFEGDYYMSACIADLTVDSRLLAIKNQCGAKVGFSTTDKGYSISYENGMLVCHPVECENDNLEANITIEVDKHTFMYINYASQGTSIYELQKGTNDISLAYAYSPEYADDVAIVSMVISDIDLDNTLEGLGTSESPYLLKTVDDLLCFSAIENLKSNSICAKLTNDITLNNITFLTDTIIAENPNDLLPWMGMGLDYNSKYSGIFDGDGHSIIGLYSDNGTGLFEVVSGGIIKNLKLLNTYIHDTNSYGNRGIGAFAITAENGANISNCSFDGFIYTYKDGDIGGIAGILNNSFISNCVNYGFVKSQCNNYVGGILGTWGYGSSVSSCANLGTVEGVEYVGGITGDLNGIISKCYNAGVVRGISDYWAPTMMNESWSIGGIVGFTWNNASSIVDCYNVGHVYGSCCVGGIIGCINSNPITMRNVFNVGDVEFINDENSTKNASGSVKSIAASSYNYDNSSKYFNCYYVDGRRVNATGNDNKNDGISVVTIGDVRTIELGDNFINGYYWPVLKDQNFTVFDDIEESHIDGGVPLDNKIFKSNDELASQYAYNVMNATTNNIHKLLILDAVDISTENLINDDEDITVESLSYSRTYKNTSWQAWYVPFGFTLTSDIASRFSFAKFAGTYTEAGQFFITLVEMQEGDEIKGNVPYFVQAKVADSSNPQVLNISNTTLYATDASGFKMLSAEKEIAIYGTYAKKVAAADDDWYAYGGGKYIKATAGQSLGAFRFYLTIRDREDNPYASTPNPIEIKVVVLGDEADGISSLNGNDSENGTMFNLAGQPVGADYKGVVIRNGKKTFIH